MALRTIGSQWDEYERRVLDALTPFGLGAKNHKCYEQARRAFYMGVLSVMGALEEIGETHISEDQGAAYLDSVRAECVRFTDAVREGRA